MEKLRACQLKRQRDRADGRRSFLERLSFIGDPQQQQQQSPPKQEKTDDEDDDAKRRGASERQQSKQQQQPTGGRLRPRALASWRCSALIRLDRFERHYDSTIADVFHSLRARRGTRLVEKRHRHGRFDTPAQRQARREDEEERRPARVWAAPRLPASRRRTTPATAVVAPSSVDGAAFRAGLPRCRLIGRGDAGTPAVAALPTPPTQTPDAGAPGRRHRVRRRCRRLRRWMERADDGVDRLAARAAAVAPQARRSQSKTTPTSLSSVTENPVAPESPSSQSAAACAAATGYRQPEPEPEPLDAAQSHAVGGKRACGATLASVATELLLSPG
ncbi:hypothetical protein PINS_up021527 [Pythium insidiosum]|nr:hypothetical protein PINS_up021527 [Pythium insidiosum]